MAPITIDTKDIVSTLGIIAVTIILFIVVAAGTIYIFSPGLHPGTTQQPVVTPTPTPAPTPSSYVTNDVTITTMSTSDGWPRVVVEDGRTFAVSWEDYDDEISLGDTVRFTVTGTTKGNSGEIVYLTSSTTVVHSEKYWNYNRHNVIYGPSVISSSDYYNGDYYNYYDDYKYNYPLYYYDPQTHTAWQWDGYGAADPISVKQLRGQRVIRGLPPKK